MFWTIFDRTDMNISLYRIVFRVELDGAISFSAAPEPVSLVVTRALSVLPLPSGVHLLVVLR